MEAVQQLSAHFQGYASIPKVAELSGRLQALQASLQVAFPKNDAVVGGLRSLSDISWLLTL